MSLHNNLFPLFAAIATIGLAAGCCVLPRTEYAFTESNDIMHARTWESYLEYAELIESVPSWRDGHLFTNSEWQRLLLTAQILQDAGRDAAIQAVMVYMVLASRCPAEEVPYIANDSRPMMLMRLMFSIPEDSRRPSTNQYVRITAGVQPKHVNDDETVDQHLGLPFDWSEGTPTLIAWPRGGGGMSTAYQPQIEMDWFYEHFKLRDLTPHIDWNSQLAEDFYTRGLLKENRGR